METAVTPDARAAHQAPVQDPRLINWERRMNPVILAAAIVPIAVALTPRGDNDPFVFIDVASWLIFLADLVVHFRLQRRYLRTGLGKFDAAIVILTFPWFLIPGLGGTAVLGLARLARLLRAIVAGGTTGVLRRLAARLGQAGLYSLVLIFVCSFVVYEVEPASSGFATFGDALWWGFVTFTTVGYGDLVPVTRTGRVVAVLLMIGGVALIGVLAGSLSDFLRSGDKAEKKRADQEKAENAATASTTTDATPPGVATAGVGSVDVGAAGPAPARGARDARPRRSPGRGPGAASRARRAPILAGWRFDPTRAVIQAVRPGRAPPPRAPRGSTSNA